MHCVCLFTFWLHECQFHFNNFPLWWNLSHTCQNVSSTWQDQCGCPAVWKCNIVFIVNFTSLEIINDLKAHKHLPNQNHLGLRMWVHCFYGLLQLKSTILHLQNSLLNISSVEKAKVWFSISISCIKCHFTFEGTQNQFSEKWNFCHFYHRAKLKITIQQLCANHNISNQYFDHKQKSSHAIVFDSKRKYQQVFVLRHFFLVPVWNKQWNSFKHWKRNHFVHSTEFLTKVMLLLTRYFVYLSF